MSKFLLEGKMYEANYYVLPVEKPYYVHLRCKIKIFSRYVASSSLSRAGRKTSFFPREFFGQVQYLHWISETVCYAEHCIFWQRLNNPLLCAYSPHLDLNICIFPWFGASGAILIPVKNVHIIFRVIWISKGKILLMIM